MAELKAIVDTLHTSGALRHGIEAAVSLVLGKRGATPPDPTELDLATAEMVRASKAHVERADRGFDAALAEREASKR